jgi:hypothetical protein
LVDLWQFSDYFIRKSIQQYFIQRSKREVKRKMSSLYAKDNLVTNNDVMSCATNFRGIQNNILKREIK